MFLLFFSAVFDLLVIPCKPMPEDAQVFSTLLLRAWARLETTIPDINAEADGPVVYLLHGWGG